VASAHFLPRGCVSVRSADQPLTTEHNYNRKNGGTIELKTAISCGGTISGIRGGAMAEPPVSVGIPEEPLGRNPFPEGDARNEQWSYVSGLARERIALFASTVLSQQPAEDATSQEYQNWVLYAVTGRFDITAGLLLTVTRPTDVGARIYEEMLDELNRYTIAGSGTFRISSTPKPVLTREIQTRLWGRRQYWTAQMLRKVREAKDVESPEIAAAADALPSPVAESVRPAPKKRGRPQTITDEKKIAAARLKASGGTNAEVATVIYDTKYPTPQQKKNVSSILRHHQQKSPVKPRKTPPKARKTRD
jgi:hypothetical protein